MISVKQKNKISSTKIGWITKLFLVVATVAGISSAPLSVAALSTVQLNAACGGYSASWVRNACITGIKAGVAHKANPCGKLPGDEKKACQAAYTTWGGTGTKPSGGSAGGGGGTGGGASPSSPSSTPSTSSPGSTGSTSSAAPATPVTGKGFCTNAAGADTCQDKALTKTCTNTKCDFVGKYINPTINMLTVVFGLIAAASLIAGGIQFSSSAGDPQKVASAKSRITNTIIAVIAYLFMYSFLEFLVPGGIFNR